MLPKIINVKEKKLIGMSLEMSIIKNDTFKLFSSFMPRRKEITNSIGNQIFDIRVFSDDYFTSFNPSNSFTKCAAIEVSNLNAIPFNMQAITIAAGDYAVFSSKNSNSSEDLIDYIFTEWLPNSNYILDNRSHFDILDECNKENEEIYIPIQLIQ